MVLRVVLSIMALFLSLVLMVVGNGMLGTVVALRLEIEGFPSGVAGLVLGLFSVGFVLGSIYGIRVVKRVGHIRAFATFGALAAATTLVHPLHISVAGWMALRLVLGFCIAGLMLVVESWTNARATAETRGKLLATYMVLFFLAASSGQFLIALGDPGQHHLFIVSAILICCSLVPLSLTRSPAPEIEESDRMQVRELWRATELGVSGAFLSGLAMSAFSAIGPIYAFQMGLAIEEVATFMGIAILAAMALQWPAGYLSDYLPRRIVLTTITAAAVAAGVLTAVLGGRSTFLLYATVALFYGLGACIYPIALALTHDMLSHRQIIPASATFLLAFGIGTIAGPMLGGLSIDLVGPSGLFLFVSVALGLLVLLAVHSFVYEKAPRVDEQAHCTGVAPVSTPVILELDPRNEEFEETPPAQIDPQESEPIASQDENGTPGT